MKRRGDNSTHNASRHIAGCSGLGHRVCPVLLAHGSIGISHRGVRNNTSIDISGLHLPFGERFLMRPGSYELNVTAEGYQTYTGSLRVDDAEVQTRAVVLTPLPGHWLSSPYRHQRLCH